VALEAARQSSSKEHQVLRIEEEEGTAAAM